MNGYYAKQHARAINHLNRNNRSSRFPETVFDEPMDILQSLFFLRATAKLMTDFPDRPATGNAYEDR